jgi:hypothetical protein
MGLFQGRISVLFLAGLTICPVGRQDFPRLQILQVVNLHLESLCIILYMMHSSMLEKFETVGSTVKAACEAMGS